MRRYSGPVSIVSAPVVIATILALVGVGLGSGDAGADLVTQQARGAAPIWSDGEIPDGLGPEAKGPAPRRALRAAISEAVGQATRDFVEREDPYLDPETAVEALGDRLAYAARYRVIEDLGRIEAGPEAETKLEYVLVIEAQIDLARIRRRLAEADLLLFGAPPPPKEEQVLVLEGDFSYASFVEIRDALGELGAEIGARAFERGRIRLDLDAPRSPQELLAALRGRLGPGLYLDPIGEDGEGLRVKVVERIEPASDQEPSGAW